MAKIPLKSVCIIGAILAVFVFAGILLFATVWRGVGAETSGGGFWGTGNTFARELQSFDLFDAPARIRAGENPVPVERRLSLLQRRARTAEEYLSALKRHRALALLDSRFVIHYENAAGEAAALFPLSPYLAAVAAEALVLRGSGGQSALLADYAGRMAVQPRFARAGLALHILAGNLDDPAVAAAIPGFAIPAVAVPADILVNDVLLRAVRGDIPGASARLDALLSTGADGVDIDAQRMAAEFFFDHGSPRRAAEILSRLAGYTGGDADIIRLADALALAGEMQAARHIWTLLLSASPSPASGFGFGGFQPEDTRSRLFFNIAASAPTRQEEAVWLQRLFSYRAQRGHEAMDSTGLYSVIRHTRLLDTPHGITVLVETAGGNETDLSQYPLLDLELTRRNLDTWPPARTAAEVWLLVNRHPADEAIYRWAAWYFEHRRLYAEAERLLNDAVRNGFSGDWIALHRALAFMRSGDIAEGEQILRELGAELTAPDWRVFANLARIYEGRRLFSSALAAYETAAVLVSAQRVAENAAAAQVQMRLSRNMEALGQRLESRIALERALELDPDNLAIRRELRRWE